MQRKNYSQILKWLTDKKTYSQKTISNYPKLKSQSEKQILKLFFNACKKIPAYSDFLKKKKFKPNQVKSIKDFKKIPITTKENYIKKYPLNLRSWNSNISENHMISSSSGTTGKPYFWPRRLQDEINGAYVHEYIFRDFFNIKNKKTLLINGFAMGNWIAGTFTMACAHLVSHKGYPLTITTPGYSLETIKNTAFNLSSFFDQTIIAGHTPFLKNIIEDFEKQKFNFKKHKIFLLGTGQAVTEEWRKYINSKLKGGWFLNLYGSADADLMGFETKKSIYIRKILNDKRLNLKKIFKKNRLPAIYQYDPRFTYFEEEDQELIITKNSGAPLIRYNLLDNGGVFKPNDIYNFLSPMRRKKMPAAPNFPFVYLFGRDKFMVKIYGANVYTENIEPLFLNKKISKYTTGRFILESSEDKNHDPLLILRVELKQNIKKSQKIKNIIQKLFVTEIPKKNSEYNVVLKVKQKKVWPKVILHNKGDKNYFPDNTVKKTA